MQFNTINCLFPLLLFTLAQTALYDCLSNSFIAGCKTELYRCTDNPECSYQLNENTHHIFLDQRSTQFPTLYFSNPLAISLYKCLQTACKLPDINSTYVSTLPRDSCLIEVYDICGGDLEQVYADYQGAAAACYRQYCK